MIEFAAFIVTLAQLYWFHKGQEIRAWVLCLLACVLWGVVALTNPGGVLVWLFLQQCLIGALAVYALNRRIPWGL